MEKAVYKYCAIIITTQDSVINSFSNLSKDEEIKLRGEEGKEIREVEEAVA